MAVLLASCSGAPDNADSATTPAPATTQAAATANIDASFDVGGHKLHLRCQGEGSPGSPAIAYLHGLAAKQLQFTKAVPNGRLVEVQSSHDIDLEQPELVINEINRILETAWRVPAVR